MLEQVEGGSIVVYAIAYSESTDEEDEVYSGEKSSNLEGDGGDRKTHGGIQENKWLRLID
ncbi:hypothetical protein K3495_g14380 [Podosphaera aphanis]|nr:hypothetical protein K3495_g14380 [Podosphaera aphanis]